VSVALLEIPKPLDFTLTTERFRAFGPDLVNLWHEGGLHRVVGGREVRIEAAPGGVEVEPFYEFAATERTLAPIVRRLAGFRPPLSPDAFEGLVSSITAQQVSLFAATAIRNRLVERFGERADHAYAFPARERLASLNDGELARLGFSRRKEEYVLGLARSDVDLEELGSLPDEEVKARIVAIRGLGEWSADWFLARHLARPRAWPAGDLGVRKAVAAFYGDVDVRAAGERFDPFQNLTVHYLLTARRVP
jgi:3-methyladenine DNA glycosylase/8-oxoguanine DNA glycosylase